MRPSLSLWRHGRERGLRVDFSRLFFVAPLHFVSELRDDVERTSLLRATRPVRPRVNDFVAQHLEQKTASTNF
jgi:hypothetical protein